MTAKKRDIRKGGKTTACDEVNFIESPISLTGNNAKLFDTGNDQATALFTNSAASLSKIAD